MSDHVRDRICREIATRSRFLLTSHARPDGDAIGSQLAMAFALRALGKDVRLVNADAAPAPFAGLPGVADIDVSTHYDGDIDTVIVMECSDLARPGVTGLEGRFIINIDHHLGNTGYGQLNWYDASAAACTELVCDLIDALGVPLSVEMATHVYLGILTDTGSFHHSHITARTFEICRRTAEAGVDAAAIARQVFDNNSFGKLKLIGALLDGMRIEADGRVAVLTMDRGTLQQAGARDDDAEGIINLPLATRDIRCVVLFKPVDPGEVRVSLRSKDDIDVRAVAAAYGGGGHKNAAGLTVAGQLADIREEIIARAAQAVEDADGAVAGKRQ